MEDDDEYAHAGWPPLRTIAVISFVFTVVFVMACFVFYPAIQDPQTRKLYRDAIETAEVYIRNKWRKEGKYSWKTTPLMLSPYKSEDGKIYVIVSEGTEDTLVSGVLFLKISHDGRSVIGEEWNAL